VHDVRPGHQPLHDTNFVYDNGLLNKVGNLTGFPGGRTATYDAENRQTTLVDGTTYTYSYDGEGRRVKKEGGGNATVYVYDAFGQLAAEYSTEAPTVGGQQYLTADHLGRTRVVTDASGNVTGRYDYFPFGGEIGSSFGNRSTVTGYGAESLPANPETTRADWASITSALGI